MIGLGVASSHAPALFCPAEVRRRAAGACRQRAEAIDYVPIHHAKHSVHFADWPEVQEMKAAAA